MKNTDGQIEEGSQWSTEMGNGILRATSELLDVCATMASLNEKNKKSSPRRFIWLDTWALFAPNQC